MSGGRSRPLAAAIALAVLAPAAFTLGIAVAAAGAVQPPATTLFCPAGTAGPGTATGTGHVLTTAQAGNARVIYKVSVQMTLPPRAAVIAIATAMQESSLINLTTPAGGGSLGLFQQRPTHGWGTPPQRTRPANAARAVNRHLARVPRWQHLPLTIAAQAVQHSAHPGAYARWQPLAQSLVTTLDGAGAPCGAAPTATGLGAAILAYAQSQAGIPYQFGGGTDTGPTPGYNSNGSGQPGWDCSGLVMYAVYQATRGKTSLPHNADLQYHNPAIQLIPYNQLQPGDLVFLPGSDGTTTNPGHVGIYAGHDTMIDAPFTGTVVRYDTIAPGSSASSTFIAGGRIIPVGSQLTLRFPIGSAPIVRIRRISGLRTGAASAPAWGCRRPGSPGSDG
jgi:cell wall-associated NlpC family hydrolase